MNPQAWIALLMLMLATGCSVVSIAVYSSRTRAITEATRGDLGKTDHRVRNLDLWRLALPSELEKNFARKETVAVELRAIHESLARIEKALEART